MKKNRRIRKVIKSKPTVKGAGVHLKRAFGFSEVPSMDPFLLLDDFRSDDPRAARLVVWILRSSSSKDKLP
jgi:redox-sensitive bicupin YhaK (pirin superfamily)